MVAAPNRADGRVLLHDHLHSSHSQGRQGGGNPGDGGLEGSHPVAYWVELR